jgi:hypothetical protein
MEGNPGGRPAFHKGTRSPGQLVRKAIALPSIAPPFGQGGGLVAMG